MINKKSNKANSRLHLARLKILPKCKRSQSETVGFVLIIIIVAVIMMIFLWFMFIGKPADIYTSADMSDLLTASMLYTTNCTTTFIPEYKTGRELLKEVYNNPDELCLDGRTVLQALNDTIRETISDVLDVNEDSPYKAYRVNISYYVKNSPNPKEQRFGSGKGSFINCTAKYGGYDPIGVPPGYLEVKLQVCKSRSNE